MARFKHPKIVLKKLGKENAWGMYDEDNNVIEIDPRLSGKLKLDIFIHERTHAHFKQMSEDDVTKYSSMMADFLWKHHVRFVDNTKSED